MHAGWSTGTSSSLGRRPAQVLQRDSVRHPSAVFRHGVPLDTTHGGGHAGLRESVDGEGQAERLLVTHSTEKA